MSHRTALLLFVVVGLIGPAKLAIAVEPNRETADRFLQVYRWTEMTRGGHFAALEEPTVYSDDLRAFARML